MSSSTTDLDQIFLRPQNFTTEGAAAVINTAISTNDYELYKRFVSTAFKWGYSQVKPIAEAADPKLFEKLRAHKAESGSDYPLPLFYRANELAELDDLLNIFKLIKRYDLPTPNGYSSVLTELYENYCGWHHQVRIPNAPISVSLIERSDPKQPRALTIEEIFFRIAKLVETHEYDTLALHYGTGRYGMTGCYATSFAADAEELRSALLDHPLFVHHYADRENRGSANRLYHSFVFSGVDEQGQQRRLLLRMYLGETRKYVNHSLEKEWRKLTNLPDEHVDLVSMLAEVGDKTGAKGIDRAPEGEEPFTLETLALVQTNDLVCHHPKEYYTTNSQHVDRNHRVYVKRTICQQCDAVIHREQYRTGEDEKRKFEAVEKTVAMIQADIDNGVLRVNHRERKLEII